jgi:hypothetical protein
MNAKERLALWLGKKTKDYKKGVEIFTELNIDVSKLSFFRVQEVTRVHENILLRQLENYARINGIRPKAGEQKTEQFIIQQKENKASEKPEVKIPNRVQKPDRPIIDTNPVVKIDELPEELKEKWFENGKLTAENKTLHAELKQIQNANEQKERRATISQTIVENEKTISENWAEIDAWWHAKDSQVEEKTPEEIAVISAFEKQKRIDANLNYIRRYFNSSKQSQVKELDKRKKELDLWNVNYEELIKKVSKPAKTDD